MPKPSRLTGENTHSAVQQEECCRPEKKCSFVLCGLGCSRISHPPRVLIEASPYNTRSLSPSPRPVCCLSLSLLLVNSCQHGNCPADVEGRECELPEEDSCTSVTAVVNINQGIGSFYDPACAAAVSEGGELPEGCQSSESATTTAAVVLVVCGSGERCSGNVCGCRGCLVAHVPKMQNLPKEMVSRR